MASSISNSAFSGTFSLLPPNPHKCTDSETKLFEQIESCIKREDVDGFIKCCGELIDMADKELEKKHIFRFLG